jgi:hypothetical protein
MQASWLDPVRFSEHVLERGRMHPVRPEASASESTRTGGSAGVAISRNGSATRFALRSSSRLGKCAGMRSGARAMGTKWAHSSDSRDSASCNYLEGMVGRDGIEPPTPGFSGQGARVAEVLARPYRARATPSRHRAPECARIGPSGPEMGTFWEHRRGASHARPVGPDDPARGRLARRDLLVVDESRPSRSGMPVNKAPDAFDSA